MQAREFNLLEEPWVRVIGPDCHVSEVSLTDALLCAHQYTDLRGELPTQDTAMLRLLLAMLDTVFSRTDASGREVPLASADDALLRWQALWQLGRFPEKPLRNYLKKWHDRFWLFDPEFPFWQVPEARCGTEYPAGKLNGEMSESNNKLRLFPVCCGAGKESLTYPQAARWLLYVNGYDDTSAKPKGKGLPSPGCGWLGKLGLITASGDNLFETLMLNLTLLRSDGELWPAARPCWELPKSRSSERTEISVPDNLAELYTLQSRRLLLERQGSRVIGYQLLGGDFFDKLSAGAEPMTLWRAVRAKGKSAEILGFQPKRHDPSRQMWREFPELFVQQEQERLPGIVQWISALKTAGILEKKKLIRFVIAAVQYGDKDFFVSDAFSDSLSFHTDLLAELGRSWQKKISGEVNRCGELAVQIGWLAQDLFRASCESNSKSAKKAMDNVAQRAKEQFYFRIDTPFRAWLAGIDPAWDRDTAAKAQESWHETVRQIAKDLGEELVRSSGESAFVGRTVTEKDGPRHYSSPEALSMFLYRIKKIMAE